MSQFNAILTFLFVLAFLLGLMITISAIVRLKIYTDRPHEDKSKLFTIIIMLIVGTLLMNLNQTIALVGNSLSGSGNLQEANLSCIAQLNDKSTQENIEWDALAVMDGDRDARGFDELSEGCIVEMSSIIEDMNIDVPSSFDVIKGKVTLIFKILMVIGYIYFIKGLIEFKKVAEGTERGGFGKPVIHLVSSALLIDLPHTLQVIACSISEQAAICTLKT